MFTRTTPRTQPLATPAALFQMMATPAASVHLRSKIDGDQELDAEDNKTQEERDNIPVMCAERPAQRSIRITGQNPVPGPGDCREVTNGSPDMVLPHTYRILPIPLYFVRKLCVNEKSRHLIPFLL